MTVPVTSVGLDLESSLCSTRHPANILTGVFTRLIQEHFASPLSMEFIGADGNEPTVRQLENFIWDRDNTKTKIQIEPVWRYNPQDIQRRPAVYVKRNTTKFERLGIDDGMTTNSRRDADGKITVEGEYHCKLIVGSFTFFAVGTTGAEAELLGQEVANHFMMFGPLLRKDLKMHRIALEEVGEVGLLDEFVEHFVVPVVVSYGLAWAWRIEQIAPWLKTLAIDLTAK